MSYAHIITVSLPIDAQTMVQLSATLAASENAADADQRLLAALKKRETA